MVSTTEIDSKPVKLTGYSTVNHLACAERALQDLFGDPAAKTPPTPGAQVRINDGHAHEATVIERLLEQYPGTVAVIAPGSRELADRQRQEADTRAALDNPEITVITGEPRLTAIGDVDGHETNLVAVFDTLVRNTNGEILPIETKSSKAFDGKAKPKAWLFSTFDRPLPGDAENVTGPEGSPKRAHALQCANYIATLDAAGYKGHRTYGVIDRDGAGIWWFSIDRKAYMVTTDEGRKKVSAWALNEITRKRLVNDATELEFDGEYYVPAAPTKVSACGTCSWYDQCLKVMREQQHISLLPGLHASHMGFYAPAGITDMVTLASFDPDTAYLCGKVTDLAALVTEARENDPSTPSIELKRSFGAPELIVHGLDTCGQVAELDDRTIAAFDMVLDGKRSAGTKVRDHIDQARVMLDGRAHWMRGVTSDELQWVQPLKDVYLEFDIEDEGPGNVYLTGFTRIEGEKVEHIEWVDWAPVPDEVVTVGEPIGLIADEIRRIEAGGQSVCVTVFSKHEEHHFSRVMEDYADDPRMPDAADWDLIQDRLVDQMVVVEKRIVWPTDSHSLKDAAKHAGFAWSDEDADGDASIAWHRRAIDTEDPEHLAFREKLRTYNRDDRYAMFVLREWLYAADLGNVADLRLTPPKAAEQAA